MTFLNRVGAPVLTAAATWVWGWERCDSSGRSKSPPHKRGISPLRTGMGIFNQEHGRFSIWGRDRALATMLPAANWGERANLHAVFAGGRARQWAVGPARPGVPDKGHARGRQARGRPQSRAKPDSEFACKESPERMNNHGQIARE
jgi:hypothetical protein